jgi:hypothetical protein
MIETYHQLSIDFFLKGSTKARHKSWAKCHEIDETVLKLTSRLYNVSILSSSAACATGSRPVTDRSAAVAKHSGAGK